jgi:Mn-dependent DtxR family transcriptional regulator
MDEHNLFKEDALRLLREVEENPSSNQRLLSKRLNISLGKTNYMLKELAKKGLEEKVNLTYHFLKAKEREYRRFKEEYEKYTRNSEKPDKEKIDV